MTTNDNLSEPQLAVDHVKKQSVAGALAYFLRTLILQGIGFISVIILGALLQPADFGIYAFVVAIIGVLTFFSDIGLAASLIQKKEPPSLSEYRTAFTLQQILSWVIVVVCLILVATGIVGAKVGLAGEWILLALALSFPLASLKTIPSVMLERSLKFSQLTLPQLFEQVVFHATLILLVWSGLGVYSYIPAILLRSVIGTVVMFGIKPWSIGLAWDRKALSGLVRIGAQFQLNDLLARIKDQLFVVVLGAWLPLTAFGYVSFAKQWSLVPYQLTVQNIIAVTFSVYSRLQHDQQLLRKAIEKTLYFIALITLPMIGLMIILVFPTLHVFPVYAKWQPAGMSLILFSLNVACSALTTPFTNMLAAIGKVHITVKLMGFWTALTWVLTPILVIWRGYEGVAWGALIVAATSFVTLVILKKYVAFSFISHVWRQTLAVLVILLVGWWGQELFGSSLANLLFGAVFLSIIYLLVVFGLGPSILIQNLRGLKR